LVDAHRASINAYGDAPESLVFGVVQYVLRKLREEARRQIVHTVITLVLQQS
jgi:hypothetical protein